MTGASRVQLDSHSNSTTRRTGGQLPPPGLGGGCGAPQKLQDSFQGPIPGDSVAGPDRGQPARR